MKDLEPKLSIHVGEPSPPSELLLFAQTHPSKPLWSEQTMERFLTQLISDPKLIIDVRCGEKRVALAVLIDQIQNTGNFACLEFLGVDTQFNLLSIYNLVIPAAAEKLPSNKSGFELTLNCEVVLPEVFFRKNNLMPYYETYEMVHDQLDTTSLEPSSEIRLLDHVDDQEFYEVLKECFHQNPDFSLTTFDNWKVAKKNATTTTTWVIHRKDKIAGFITIELCTENQEGEIKTIGVMPQYRGQSLGRALLCHGLSQFAQQGIKTCTLVVAIQNQKALTLYINLGFKVKEHFRVFYSRSTASAR